MLVKRRISTKTTIKVFLLIFCIFFVDVTSKFVERNPLRANAQEEEELFPFVGMNLLYDVTQSTGSIIAASGSLSIEYLTMLDETHIFGEFHVEVVSPVDFYNETTGGSEDLLTRHLDINTENTYIIWLFWEYFFDRSDEIIPTPMWVFPRDLEYNTTVKIQNYTSITTSSESISIMDKYYEVFVHRTYGSTLNMTLLYGYARHGTSDWYGVLFYMAGYFVEPVTDRRMAVFFKLRETNAELLPLKSINQNTILSITITFYGVVIGGAIIYRVRKRRELVGGEV
ncbi:MAG: hypothetical protein KGD59_03790 [Candidatus Heimdallarchaeota archaeon]|nr:hypothetical protein [Candidatus Heimdallarchaeota archaeon]MBY8993646.1 hypothetical protein [Candidatus Heimdallarchaeota archaeon]